MGPVRLVPGGPGLAGRRCLPVAEVERRWREWAGQGSHGGGDGGRRAAGRRLGAVLGSGEP
jgi:hypothetical protein